MSQHYLKKEDGTVLSLDQIHKTLTDAMKEIASDFDLVFNIWRPKGNNVGRLYLNRSDRTAVCWIEENNSKNYIDSNIGEKLREVIEVAFKQYSTDYNAFYISMEA